MKQNKPNELQIRLLAIAQVLEKVSVSGAENWKLLSSCVMELQKFSQEVAGKALVDETKEG